MSLCFDEFVLTNNIIHINDTQGKNLFSPIRYKNGCLAASGLFQVFTQSIKFCTLYYYIRFTLTFN